MPGLVRETIQCQKLHDQSIRVANAVPVDLIQECVLLFRRQRGEISVIAGVRVEVHELRERVEIAADATVGLPREPKSLINLVDFEREHHTDGERSLPEDVPDGRVRKIWKIGVEDRERLVDTVDQNEQ